MNYLIADKWRNYAAPLPQITDELVALTNRVDRHIKKIGAVWN